ncbi:MAG: Uma2 family endonuclease [Synechococcales cyanobacterium C42_A2020_086]|nr:Uma2 family endonuclease [Synechococcales cyanobacterium C42_A2020_086]
MKYLISQRSGSSLVDLSKITVVNTFTLAPDWTIEILFPEQSQTRVVLNILHCLAHGTQMSWLIDPEEELVIVYFADRTLAVFATPGDPIPSPAFAQPFSVTVGQVFGWLEE